jgi:hypothetical protein
MVENDYIPEIISEDVTYAGSLVIIQDIKNAMDLDMLVEIVPYQQHARKTIKEGFSRKRKSLSQPQLQAFALTPMAENDYIPEIISEDVTYAGSLTITQDIKNAMNLDMLVEIAPYQQHARKTIDKKWYTGLYFRETIEEGFSGKRKSLSREEEKVKKTYTGFRIRETIKGRFSKTVQDARKEFVPMTTEERFEAKTDTVLKIMQYSFDMALISKKLYYSEEKNEIEESITLGQMSYVQLRSHLCPGDCYGGSTGDYCYGCNCNNELYRRGYQRGY